MHKGKYRHMHLFSLHTQPQLCNITEGKEQALSQLDCRAKPFLSYRSLWWEMPIFTQGFICIRRFQAGGFWIHKLGQRGPQGQTTQITVESYGSTGSQQGLAAKWRATGCSTMDQLWGRLKKCIYIGGLNCPPWSLFPGGGLYTSRGLGLGSLFVSAQKCEKVDTWGPAVNEQKRTLSADSVKGLTVRQKPQETSKCYGTAKWFQALSLASAKPHFFTHALQPEARALFLLLSSHKYFKHVKYSVNKRFSAEHE